MKKGRGKGTDTSQTDNGFTRKEYIERDAALNACFDGFADCRDDCADNIRNLPAADVVARDCYDRLLAENDELRKERPMVRTPYKVGDLFWAVAYSDPRVIHVRLYQVTYHYKDGWVLWVENIDNDNDWWKVPLETFETWSCFGSYEAAAAALEGESKDV